MRKKKGKRNNNNKKIWAKRNCNFLILWHQFLGNQTKSLQGGRERKTLVKRGDEYLRRLGLRLTAMAKTTSRWGFGNASNVRTRGGSGKWKESDNAAAVLCPYSFTCEPILILILILILIFDFVCLLRREFKSKQ